MDAQLRHERIVVVADILGSTIGTHCEQRRDLEQTEVAVFDGVKAAMAELGLAVVHYEDPGTLGECASRHLRDLVFSIYGGARSRNRMLLVPAVCEAAGLSYVGLDAYGRALAQDKEASKTLAERCGLLTPLARVIRGPDQIGICTEFPLPYVLKPLHEGSSIGISQENLIRDARFGLELAEVLLRRFDQPVLIERFVEGREISFTAIETPAGHDVRLAEIVVEGEPDWFRTRLFDADEKLNCRLPRRAVRVVDPVVSDADWEAARRFLAAVGHYGYARIDGRVLDGRFHFIEFTPDAFIGPLGQFAAAYVDCDNTYAELIGRVLRSALLKPRDPPASD